MCYILTKRARHRILPPGEKERRWDAKECHCSLRFLQFTFLACEIHDFFVYWKRKTFNIRHFMCKLNWFCIRISVSLIFLDMRISRNSHSDNICILKKSWRSFRFASLFPGHYNTYWKINRKSDISGWFSDPLRLWWIVFRLKASIMRIRKAFIDNQWVAYKIPYLFSTLTRSCRLSAHWTS